MKAKRFPVSTIFVGITVSVLMLTAIGYLANSNTVSWSGFAIDERGLLYIAGTGVIDVIQQGNKVRELDVPTSRGFDFTIENGDTIIVITGTECYKLDLCGNIIDKSDANQDLRAKIVKESSQYTTKDGLTYCKSAPWGRPQIAFLQNGKEMVAYQMPIIDYIVRIILFFAAIGLCYCLIMLFRWKYMKSI